jgi:hypothetical protein
MQRNILCCNCNEWKVAPNVELGTCTFDNGNDTTWYNSKCIYGLSENVIPGKLEITTKEVT